MYQCLPSSAIERDIFPSSVTFGNSYLTAGLSECPKMLMKHKCACLCLCVCKGGHSCAREVCNEFRTPFRLSRPDRPKCTASSAAQALIKFSLSFGCRRYPSRITGRHTCSGYGLPGNFRKMPVPANLSSSFHCCS